MKKTFLTLIFCGLTIITSAQDVGVEKSTYGYKLDFLEFGLTLKQNCPIKLLYEVS